MKIGTKKCIYNNKILASYIQHEMITLGYNGAKEHL